MSADKGISEFQADNLAAAIFGRRATYQELLFAHAVEQAVIQSPEVRKALAVSSLVDQFFTSSNSIPVERAVVTKAAVDAAISAAMEQKP